MKKLAFGMMRLPLLDENDDVKAIYPIHLNPVVRKTANAIFADDDKIHIIPLCKYKNVKTQ